MLAMTLEKMVGEGTPPDVITFAGNGEPTMHPEFEAIIDDTIAMRDKYCPSAKVSVLSNATQIHREDVRRALQRVDNNILKLDSAFDATVQLMNKPQGAYTVARTVELLKAFNGDLIVQTMFLRGEYLGQRVDNTTEEEVSAWLELIAEIKPKQVMVYSLDRDTPCKTLEKVEKDELRGIADRVEALGIACSVA
jgi:wyosine [tRNA(Phe)-imidazoG37] synthetase (radical SAM superfamily)